MVVGYAAADDLKDFDRLLHWTTNCLLLIICS